VPRWTRWRCHSAQIETSTAAGGTSSQSRWAIKASIRQPSGAPAEPPHTAPTQSMIGFTTPVAISPQIHAVAEAQMTGHRACPLWVHGSAIHAASAIELAAVGSGPWYMSLITGIAWGASCRGSLESGDSTSERGHSCLPERDPAVRTETYSADLSVALR
jgi:hypothetical protein